MHMDYRYLSIFRVSGIKLPDASSEVVIADGVSTGRKISIKSDIDSCCFVLDRGAAIGTVMLQTVFGGGNADSLTDRIDKEVELIRGNRRRKFGGGPFVILEFSGEIDAHPSKPFHDLGEFVVSFDLIDKNQVRDQFKKEMNQFLMSLFLAVERDYNVKKVKDGIYLISQGKIWYSLTFAVSGKCVVSRPINDAFLCCLSDYSAALDKTVDFEDVYRLLVQSSDEDIDNLQSFLFAWTALEIFVNKTFKEYEQRFFDAYVVREVPSPAQQFFSRMKNVMKDKYRLRDKFMAISACLSSESEKDLEEFVSAQKVRNNLLHGKPIDESNLPIKRIVLLLRKYLLNHLVPKNPQHNSITVA